MRRARLALLAGAVLLTALLALPGGAMASETVTVTGTVVRDGQPQVGVTVVVTVSGGDTVARTSTDEEGAFSVDLEAGLGSEIRFSAEGQETRSGPDANGCTESETPIGSATAVIDALPPAPVVVPLDQLRTLKGCTATGTPRITPPATDVPSSAGQGTSSGSGLLLVLGVLALAGAASLAVVRPRR